MKWKILLAALSVSVVSFASSAALAGDQDKDHPCGPDDKNCHPPHEVCFNVFCTYDRGDKQPQAEGLHDEYDRCHAGVTFKKWVTDQGDEIFDSSEDDGDRDRDRDRAPKFEVECDGKPVYNNSAHRFTDWQGTRIQALAGPYPAVVLPKGVLRDTHEYAVSALELWDQTLHGYCFVYTGEQLR